jgi:hypothetical protein
MHISLRTAQLLKTTNADDVGKGVVNGERFGFLDLKKWAIGSQDKGRRGK